MAITALPPVPQRSDLPANFITKADAFLAALPLFQAEANAVAIAMNLNSTNSLSVTSLSIGLGSKSLTVDTGKSYVPGMTVKVAYTTSPSNWMVGDVTSYNAGTGALVVNVKLIQGAGSSLTAWTVSQSAPVGDGNPPGTIIQYSGASVPTNYLNCPTAASTQLIADFPALFAAIGTLWGGDGITTFGIPFFASDEVAVQVAAGTVGSHTNGVVKDHTHTVVSSIYAASQTVQAGTGQITIWQGTAAQNNTSSSASGSGTTNLPAGQRVKYCVKY